MWVGARLIREAMRGLLDVALPDEQHQTIVRVLSEYAVAGDLHGLQTRESGKDRFMSVHMLVPGEWSVTQAHDRVEEVEQQLRSQVADLQVLTHPSRGGPPGLRRLPGGWMTEELAAWDPTDGAGG